jgi:hypothetical protein
MEIREGETLTLTTGAQVVVKKIHNGQAWIRRPDGRFPRAVSLDWLQRKVTRQETAGAVQVKRDGAVQATFDSDDPVKNSNDAFAWLLGHQSQSVDWAVKHEGWEITGSAPQGGRMPEDNADGNPYAQFTPEHRVWAKAQENGKAAASWIFDGNTTQAEYARVLKGIEDGDPEVMDAYREPDLSGEFAGDYSEDQLMADAGWVPHDGTDLRDDLAAQYNSEVSAAFWHEAERLARSGAGTCSSCGCPEQAGELTDCRRCGAIINTAYGADSPAEHAGAAGTREDPRSPGDHDDICDVCNYS